MKMTCVRHPRRKRSAQSLIRHEIDQKRPKFVPLQEIVEKAAPLKIWLGINANSFWEGYIDVRTRECKAIDPFSDNVQRWSGRNEAARAHIEL